MLLCYSTLLGTTTETTPLSILSVCYPRQEHTVHLETGASREQSACLVSYQPLEALKPVECLRSFSVHGKVSDNAGDEQQQLTRFMLPPFSSFAFLPMSPPPCQFRPPFTTTCLRKTCYEPSMDSHYF